MAEQIVSTLTLHMIIGASFSESITWKDAAGTLVPFPLGTTAEVHVRSTLASPDAIVQFSTSPTASEGLIVLISPGVAELSLEPAQTVLLPSIEAAVFDIKYYFPDGRVVVKLDEGRGRVDIHKAVTRT